MENIAELDQIKLKRREYTHIYTYITHIIVNKHAHTRLFDITVQIMYKSGL